jgi:hypothetical protein
MPVPESATNVEANFDRQEALVAALYRFHEGQQDNEHNCKYRATAATADVPYRSIHLPSVDSALTEILGIFGQPRVHTE